MVDARSPGSVRCFECQRFPVELPEYVDAAEDCGMEPDEYVREEEGTFNPESGNFCCTECYVKIGMPSSPNGWRAP